MPQTGDDALGGPRYPSSSRSDDPALTHSTDAVGDHQNLDKKKEREVGGGSNGKEYVPTKIRMSKFRRSASASDAPRIKGRSVRQHSRSIGSEGKNRATDYRGDHPFSPSVVFASDDEEYNESGEDDGGDGGDYGLRRPRRPSAHAHVREIDLPSSSSVASHDLSDTINLTSEGRRTLNREDRVRLQRSSKSADILRQLAAAGRSSIKEDEDDGGNGNGGEYGLQRPRRPSAHAHVSEIDLPCSSSVASLHSDTISSNGEGRRNLNHDDLVMLRRSSKSASILREVAAAGRSSTEDCEDNGGNGGDYGLRRPRRPSVHAQVRGIDLPRSSSVASHDLSDTTSSTSEGRRNLNHEDRLMLRRSSKSAHILRQLAAAGRSSIKEGEDNGGYCGEYGLRRPRRHSAHGHARGIDLPHSSSVASFHSDTLSSTSEGSQNLNHKARVRQRRVTLHSDTISSTSEGSQNLNHNARVRQRRASASAHMLRTLATVGRLSICDDGDLSGGEDRYEQNKIW